MRRTRLAELGVVAALGAAVGVGVAGFEWLLVEVVLGRLVTWAWAPLAGLAATGLVVGALVLRWPGRRTTPAIADAYIVGIHGGGLDLRVAPPRVTAFLTVVGSGLPMGAEAPLLYLGGVAGTALHRWLKPLDERALMTGGAAAGVAALFGMPLVGAVLAVEVPYRRGLDRRSLPEAAVGAVAGWLVSGLLHDSGSVVPVPADPPWSWRLVAAVAVAALSGALVARGFAWLVRRAKAAVLPVGTELLAGAGVVAAGLAFAHGVLGDVAPAVGGGAAAIAWAADPSRSVPVLIGALALRLVITPAALLGRAAGGLFVPLVALGGVAGAAVAHALGVPAAVVMVAGATACVACGYRVPWAAVALGVSATAAPLSALMVAGAVALAWPLAPRVGVSAVQAAQPPTRSA